MKFRTSILAFFCVLWCSAALAQKPALPPPPPPPQGGALEAISLIPKEAAKRLARIEAREARPLPERWYLIVHDPETPTGLREFVISRSRIVAARQLSQFADSVTEADSFGEAWVRADSEYCTQLAAAYANANGAKIGSLDFELARPRQPKPAAPPVDPAAPAPSAPAPPPAAAPLPESAWPVWKVTIIDPNGDQAGVLIISAARGTVISAFGLDKTPDASLLPAPLAPPPASLTNPRPAAKKTEPKPSGSKKKGR